MTDEDRKLIEKIARTTGAAINANVALASLFLHDPHHQGTEQKLLITSLIASGLIHMDDMLEIVEECGGDVSALRQCRTDMYDSMVGKERRELMKVHPAKLTGTVQPVVLRVSVAENGQVYVSNNGFTKQLDRGDYYELKLHSLHFEIEVDPEGLLELMVGDSDE